MVCGYWSFEPCSFDNNKNKCDFYRASDCMKKFYWNLKEHTTEIIKCEKKKGSSASEKLREKVIQEIKILSLCKE